MVIPFWMLRVKSTRYNVYFFSGIHKSSNNGDNGVEVVSVTKKQIEALKVFQDRDSPKGYSLGLFL